MYIIFFATVLVYIVLFLYSRGIEGKKRKGIPGIFDGIALALLRITEVCRKTAVRIRKRAGPADPGRKKEGIINTLTKLRPGEKTEILYREYLVGKLSLSLMVVLIGTVIATGIRFTNSNEKDILADGVIKREDYNGEATEYYLKAGTDEGDFDVALTVNPKKLSDEEVAYLLPDFYEKLGKALAGNNKSLDMVDSDLKLVNRLDGYPFSVEWSSSDTEMVAAGTGKVSEVDETCAVKMTANIQYGEMRFEHEYSVTLVPKTYSNEESFLRGLQKLLSESEKETAMQDEYILPENYDGKEIKWKEAVVDYSIYVFAAVIVIAVVIYKLSDKDLNSKLEEKKKKLKRSYPEILHKLVLYIGAGMTVRAAFIKISSCVEMDEPVYEEMIYTCREMKKGIPEGEVYYRFGRRCGLQEYIRLSTLLGQNLKRGSSNLLERLREEADNAYTERIQDCRKAGEEAVTKLLLPMVMMLLVVMVMILLPAFSNMNL